MPYTDFERMQMQAEALFVHDANGRLLRINEPEPVRNLFRHPAPRFFLGRTASGNLWRTRFDLPDELTAELERLAADEPVSHDLHTPPKHEAEYRELLRRHAPIRDTFAGPAYILPEDETPHQAMLVTLENIAVMKPYFAWLQAGLADYAPVAVVAADGAAVAACFSSRITARVCEAGVYTEAAYRGRGYAVETVRGWAAAVRAAGRLPLYSTSWENSTSQAVASKLGAVQYGADFSVT